MIQCVRKLAAVTVTVAVSLALWASSAAALPVPGDPFEPNDTTATATPIQTDGTDYTHYTDARTGLTPDDFDYGQDYLSFSVKQGALYSVDVWFVDIPHWSGISGLVSVVSSQGLPLTEVYRVYDFPMPLKRFYFTAAVDDTVYLAYEYMDANSFPGDPPLVPYHVRVLEHTTPSIAGTVRNPTTGSPVQGALVQAWVNPEYMVGTARPFEWAGYVTTTTAADGTYLLQMPKPGTVWVRFDDPAGHLIGEWYDSSPTIIDGTDPAYSRRLRTITSVEDSRVSGVDGSLLEPGRVEVRFVRGDTKQDVPALKSSVITQDSNSFWGDRTPIPASDANGVAVLGQLDPRRTYTVLPNLTGKGLLAENQPSFRPLPGETTTVTLTLLPVFLETVSDAVPVYGGTARIHLSASGNTPGRSTCYSLDGGPWTWSTDFETSVLGPHELRFYSTDGWDNAEETKSARFSVVARGKLQGTVWGPDGSTPLAGASVLVGSMNAVSTDANGHYQVADIAEDTYDVTYSKSGYATRTLTGVSIPLDATTTSNVILDAQTLTPVYRFYNKKNGSHFYTASESEKASVIKNLSAVYVLDGTAYTVNTSNPANSQWLYRFYNRRNGSHFYTASEIEKASVIKNLSAVYSYDGPAYKVCAGSPPANSKTVWRFYNKKNGSHFYTGSEVEKADVIKNLSLTYSLEGVAFYVVQ